MTPSFLSFIEENSFNDALKLVLRLEAFLTIIIPRLAPAIIRQPAGSLRLKDINITAVIRTRSTIIE